MLRFKRSRPELALYFPSRMVRTSAGGTLVFALIVAVVFAEDRDGGQTPASSQKLNLAIIVVATQQDAESALKQLNEGADFGGSCKGEIHRCNRSRWWLYGHSGSGVPSQ